MGLMEVKVVAWAIEIRRHGGAKIPLILTGIRLAELDSRDFGDGVGLVGLLEGAREERIFGDRLGGKLWINAGAPEEKEFGGAEVGGGGDEIVLDLQVLQQKLYGEIGVCFDPADLGGGDDHGLRASLIKEISHGEGIDQIDFRAGLEEEIGVAYGLEFSNDRPANQTAVTGDKNGVGFIHGGEPSSRKAFVKPKPHDGGHQSENHFDSRESFPQIAERTFDFCFPEFPMKSLCFFSVFLVFFTGSLLGECRFCGSSSFGSGCSYSPTKVHEHLSDSDRCDFCGSKSYGSGCSYSPSGRHRHGHGEKCLWCGSSSYGSGCSYSPRKIHER